MFVQAPEATSKPKQLLGRSLDPKEHDDMPVCFEWFDIYSIAVQSKASSKAS